MSPTESGVGSNAHEFWWKSYSHEYAPKRSSARLFRTGAQCRAWL